MTDISVIILVGNEALHIRRCLEKLAPLEPRQIIVVESQKGDATHEIVEGAKGELQTLNIKLQTVWHDWPGLYARQFNWALDNLPIESKWVLRLDADEYLTEETIEKLRGAIGSSRPTDEFGVRGAPALPLGGESKNEPPLSTSTSSSTSLPEDVTGLNIELKRRFCGGEIRHATTGIRQARIFRYGIGRCEDRAMDEHIILSSGRMIDFDGAFYDDNLNTMDWWREKHHGYAKREAADAIAFERGEIHFKPMKEKYYRMPRYFRAFAYFCIRYFLKGGILDGYAGWMWNFWQGLWYRLLVDREIGRLRREVKG